MSSSQVFLAHLSNMVTVMRLKYRNSTDGQRMTQTRPGRPWTRCDHDGVSCGLFSSQFHCVECLALLPNKTSLPLDKAALNPTAFGESNLSLLSNCVDYFLFLEETFHPCCFFKSRTRRVIISLEETLTPHQLLDHAMTSLFKNTQRSSKYIHSIT